MLIYRFFPIRAGDDEKLGRDFFCRNDAHAMTLAQEMMVGFASIEVWREHNMVGSVAARAQQSIQIRAF